MRDRLDEFGDAAIAVVTFSEPAASAAYQRDQLAPLTVLVDTDRRCYHAYGIGRGRVWRVWGPKTWWVYAGLIRRGRWLRRPTEDTLQLGGDVVVRSDGRVGYLYRSGDPGDRPSLDDLIAAVRDARRG